MTRHVFIAASCLVVACNPDPPVSSEPTEGSSEPALEVPIEPVLPSGAALLLGEFEYDATHNGIEIHRALRVTEDAMIRLIDGRVTSEANYSVVEDGPGRVTVDVREDGRPPARRSYGFSDADHVADIVTPEFVFQRTASAAEVEPVPDEGSSEGS